MKYLKTYEQIKEPQIGDYVLCKTSYGTPGFAIDEFMKNNIGQITEPRYTGTNKELADKVKYSYIVTFDNVPSYLQKDYFYKHNTRIMSLHEIEHFSPNKKNLEIKIASRKYNL